jgi:hypothetical protein
VEAEFRRDREESVCDFLSNWRFNGLRPWLNYNGIDHGACRTNEQREQWFQKKKSPTIVSPSVANYYFRREQFAA